MTDTATETVFHINGVDVATGKYLVEPLAFAEVLALAQQGSEDPSIKAMAERHKDLPRDVSYGLPYNVDPYQPEQAGWGIVIPEGTPREVRAALEPLIAHRKGQIPDSRCLELNYRSGESVRAWLNRRDLSFGDVDPTVVPYYLLLVGGPEVIPFDFQYLLDVDYAVGRISFDTPEEYRRYVKSVIDYETAAAKGQVPTRRQLLYWGPDNDPATEMSTAYLLRPLLEEDGKRSPVAKEVGFQTRSLMGAEATKSALVDVLHGRGGDRPAMIFTASHGAGFDKGSARQRPEQGALISQDSARMGPSRFDEALVRGADIGEDAELHGLVCFLFACFGAGTPQHDDFMSNRSQVARELAAPPFVSRLAQRLLGHPKGGALGIVGHVDRAWGCSFAPINVSRQIGAFRNAVGYALSGRPLGMMTKDFSDRYSMMSTSLIRHYDATRPDMRLSDSELVYCWLERNDAQNYILLGDPAVQLRPEAMTE